MKRMSNTRKCPRCGEILEPEDLECPYCGCTDIPQTDISFDKEYSEGNRMIATGVAEDAEIEPDLGWVFATDEDLADEEIFDKEDSEPARLAHIQRAEEMAPIIARIKTNDPNKEELLMAVHNYIYKHMLSIAINQMDHDKAWAEDVYIETFNYLMQDHIIKTLKYDDKFEGWFAISLMNRCKNAWRRKGKIQKHETFESSLKNDEVNFFENIPAGALADPSVQFEQKELVEGLHALMKELPKIQEACIDMTWINGSTCKVAAAALDIPEGTVKTNVSKAKKYIEHRILELRKENRSFYAIAPVPFLIWMMQKELENIQASEIAIKACELGPVVQNTTQTGTQIAVDSATVAEQSQNSIETVTDTVQSTIQTSEETIAESSMPAGSLEGDISSAGSTIPATESCSSDIPENGAEPSQNVGPDSSDSIKDPTTDSSTNVLEVTSKKSPTEGPETTTEAETTFSETATSTESTASAVTSAGKGAGGILGKVVTTKGIVGLVCGAVVVAGAVTYMGNSSNNSQNTEKNTEKVSETTEEKKDKDTEKETKKDDKSVFDSVLAKYQALIDAPKTGTYDESYDSGESHIISCLETSGGGNENGLGYAYVDINDDGQSELLIGDAREEESSTIYDIYANVNGETKLIKDETTKQIFGEKATNARAALDTQIYCLTNKNKVVFYYDDGGSSLFSINSFDGKKLNVEAKYGAYDRMNCVKLNLKTNEEKSVEKSEYTKVIDKYSKHKKIKFTPFVVSQPETTTQQEESQETAVADSSSTATSSMQTVELKYANASMQIPTMFAYKGESQSEQAQLIMTEYSFDGEGTNLAGLDVYLNTGRLSKEEFPTDYVNWKNNTPHWTKSEMEQNSPSYLFYGNENQYVYYKIAGSYCSIYIVNNTGDYASYSISMGVLDPSTVSQEQIQELTKIETAIAQSITFH